MPWLVRVTRTCCALSVGLFTVLSAIAAPRLGMNLGGLTYYGREAPFIDGLKHSQPFFAQKKNADWQVADPGAVVFRPDGYPSQIAADHTVGGLWDIPINYPGGPHVLQWEGQGAVSIRLASDPVISSAPGRMVIDLPASGSQPQRRLFQIDSTNPADPVRNMRFVPLAVESQFTGGEPANPFRANFTDRYRNFSAFRYMDWSGVNNSTLANWSDRAKPSDQTQTDNGVALEYQIAHANLTRSQPWFTLPHLATDDFIRNAAVMIRDSLAPDLTARIELSNEVWNGQFAQAQYALSQASNFPGEGGQFGGALRWYSQRSVEMFEIFSEVFTRGGTDPAGQQRLVRVLSAQAANPWTAQQILNHENAFQKADALAIAPYFGEVPNVGPEADAWKNATWPQRIGFVEESLQESFTWMDNYATLLADNPAYSNLKLFAYEAGQHFVGAGNTLSDNTLAAVLTELNRRPEMRGFYQRYLQHWASVGGDDLMIFSSLGEFTKYGSWGHLEYEGQPLSTAPKLLGVLDYLAASSRAGDYNGDGAVNLLDYYAWRAAFGTTNPASDGNRNGSVDAGDYARWRDNLPPNLVGVELPATPVPEPAAVVLLVGLMLMLCHSRKFGCHWRAASGI